MSRLISLAITCLMIGLLAVSAAADTQVEKSNYLYFKIGNGSAFTRYSRTDTMQTIAQLPLQVRFDDPAFADSTLEGVTVKFFFNKTGAELKSIIKDTGWAGTVTSTTVTTGPTYDTVTVRFRGGTGRPSQTFKTYAYLNFTPICGLPGDTTRITFSTNPQADDYISIHNGYVYSPDGVNQTEGKLTRAFYNGDGFDIQDSIYSNSVGDTIDVNVWGVTFSRVRVVAQRIRFDTLKLEYVGTTFGSMWNSMLLDNVDHDTVIVYMENSNFNGAPELSTDSAIYVLHFRAKPALANSTTELNYGASGCLYKLAGCSNWRGGASLLDGSVTLSDNAALCIEPQTSSPTVRKQISNVRHNIKLSSTFDAGIPGSDTIGVKVAMDLGHYAFTLASPTSGGTNYTWHYTTTDGRGSTWQWNSDGQQTKRRISASPTCQTIGTIDLRWNAPDSVVDWANQYIQPSVIASFGGYATSVPAYDGSWTATPSNGLTIGNFSQSIKVLMSQPGTNTINEPGPEACVWQTLRIRSNFSLKACSLVVKVPWNATFGDSASMRSGLHVSRISDSVWALYGTLTTAISPSTSFTDLAQFRIDRHNCNGGSMNVSMRVLHTSSWVKMYESSVYYQGYVAKFDSGAATITCPTIAIDCDQILDPQLPTDVTDDISGLPKEFALKQNYPNPFNPVTTISLALPVSADWTIIIYNINGQVVETFEGSSGAGTVNVTWNAAGKASGIYFYKAEAGSFVETKKMLLLK